MDGEERWEREKLRGGEERGEREGGEREGVERRDERGRGEREKGWRGEMREGHTYTAIPHVGNMALQLYTDPSMYPHLLPRIL